MTLNAPVVTFGRWTVNIVNGCLEIEIVPAGNIYQIPLEEMTDSARILDWILQLAEKTWASSADVGDLVRAIEQIFGRGVCGGGRDAPIDAKQILLKKYGIAF